MTEFINRENIINRFIEYTSDYDLSDPKIKLKYDHTFRVANLCERIAKGNLLSEDDCALAWLTGILHDIGRFEQVRRMGLLRIINRLIMHSLVQICCLRMDYLKSM